MIEYTNIPSLSGIYSIVNTKSGKCYVGSAIDLKRRAYEHLSSLRKGNHFNRYLQRSWNKNGEELFRFEVLELCQPEDLLDKETHYIKSKDVYNASKDCSTWLGRKHTEETKSKIRAARAKQVIPPESYAAAAQKLTGRKMNFSKETIRKLSQRAKNMDRSFSQTKEFREKISSISKARLRKVGRPFICKQTGETFYTTGDAANKLGISSHKSVWRVLSGHRKSVNGFTFEYLGVA